MTTHVPPIRPGLFLVNEDGDLVMVSQVNLSREAVHLKVDDGGSYTIGMRELRRALVDGDYAIAEGEEEEVEDELDSQ